MIHPPEMYEKIVELWNKPMTGEAIAMSLGMTKGAVIGIVHRARLRGYLVMQHDRLTTTGTFSILENREVPKKPVSIGKLCEPVRPTLKLVVKPMEEPVIRKKNVAIYELSSDGCKYPTITANDCAHKFCNAPTDKVYCENHKPLMYQKHEGRVPYARWGK